MSWRDRDWARFDDGERRRLFDAGSPARRRVQRSVEIVVMLALVVGTTFYVARDWNHTSGDGRDAGLTPALPIPNHADASAIRIRWGSTDLAPAHAAGRICITDALHGKICAGYTAGERPADTLSREIERRGLHVQSAD